MNATPIRVVVSDDESVARKGLCELLRRAPGVEVVGEAADGDELIGLIRETRPDVVLLDINMPKVSGLDVVDAIGPVAMPLVIFVTAHDEHAARAFDLQALDYVVKPYREERIHEALARARQRLRQREPGRHAYAARLRVEKHGIVRFVALREVRWIEAQDYCVLLHTDRERILRRGTLKQFLEALDPAVFVRVHRSAALNVHWVRDLTVAAGGGMTARLEDGTEVPVARGFRPELEARLRELP